MQVCVIDTNAMLFYYIHVSFCTIIKVQYIIKYINLVVLKLIKKLLYQLWLNKVIVEGFHIGKKY